MTNKFLEEIFKSFKLPLTEKRRRLITEAFVFAQKAHQGQKRKSGDDYIQHSLETAKILAEIGMGSKTIAAGLLHDVSEDTPIQLDEIEKKFGKEISTMVDGITKLGKIKLRGSREEYFLENLRKMFLAMASDIRVAIIKLADRLHNMKTLSYLSPEKQQRIAQETMDIYVPIANRLGIGGIKEQLEDLCFQYLDPDNWAYIKELREKHYKQGEKYISKAIKEIKNEFKKSGIEIKEIYGRAKSLYRLFLKLKKYEMDISRIYDLIAIRVIVVEVVNCYEALGIIHKKYRPLVGRIKDYISLPKPNGYQSIHTTIFGPEGKLMEVQIRTEKMHQEAEFGIAAHWLYSEKEKNKSFFKKYIYAGAKNKVPKEELRWVEQLRDWQKEIGRDDEEFIQGLKIDFFKKRIFAFTPMGDIIELPEEATPVDFAYSIHTEIGNKTIGAKVDGKIVPLDYQIKNGQMVEILVSKENKLPNRKWLNFVKTSTARAQIRKQTKKDNLL